MVSCELYEDVRMETRVDRLEGSRAARIPRTASSATCSQKDYGREGVAAKYVDLQEGAAAFTSLESS